MELDFLRVLVDDFDACLVFYRDVLGLPLKWGPAGGYASFETGTDTGLSIFRRDYMAAALGREIPPTEPCPGSFVVVLRVPDVDESVARVRDRGGQILTEPQDRADWGIRTAHLSDPDGHLVEIVSHLPEDRWSDGLKQADRVTRRN